MYIYSGSCRLCETGILTTLQDDLKNYLYTGDIVMAYTVTEEDVADFDTLTVVVADHYENVLGKDPVRNDTKEGYFVMGIKNVDLLEPIKKYPNHVWRVKRLKSYKDVVHGEHWKEYGFCYRR